jgi:uncharacterized protein (TIGR02145 family)
MIFFVVSIIGIAQIPTNGLVAWYPFNGNANDASGNGNNGTVYGATLVNDRFGNSNSAYSFNGSNYIDILSTGIPNNPEVLTECAWVKTTINGQCVILTRRHLDDGTDWPTLMMQDDKGVISADDQGYKIDAITTSPINDGVWHFIVGIRNHEMFSVYFDGQLQATITTSYSFGGSILNLHIGHHGAWNSWFNGTLDDIRIYNRALSSSEIQSLYLENTGITCPSSVSYSGKTYNTVLIGTQCWFKENLNVGTKINGLQDQTNNGVIEKYCFDNLESNCDIYGGLYQWNEMMQYSTSEGTIGICPQGWHIPKYDEWTSLTNYLGGGGISGGKMKETGLTHWQSPNTGATNTSGFTALPGGYRHYNGSFNDAGYYAIFWSSSESSEFSWTTSWGQSLYYNGAYIQMPNSYKVIGCSVHCLKDATGAAVNLAGNLSFGNVVIDHTAQLYFTICNTGSIDISVSSIAYPNGYTGNWNGGYIAAGTSKTVMVTFTPIAVQSYSGVVTVNSNAGSGSNTMPISGSGVQNTIGLSVSGNLDFGTVMQGSMNDKPVFLYNNTSSVITINNITPSPTGAFTVLMQNGSDILPNHSLPISVSFFPSGLQTYNTTFTVTSNAANGNVTFTATGIGGTNPISRIGFYTKPENNSEIKQQTLDEHDINQGATAPVKICADGSKATTVKFINNDPSVTTSNIVFNMMSDPLGNNTDFTGWFVTTDYTYNGNTVIAKFTHPKYLNISGLYRSDNLQVVNSADGNVIYSQPVQIYRAPVLLVHGLWGDIGSMNTIDENLRNSGKYNRTLLRNFGYTKTHAASFSTNSNVIKEEINNHFNGLLLMKYSAGKVDIIAHSMGGILSRLYLQNNDCANGITTNCYRGDIHKLLTLNTPHSGTQIASFLLSNNIAAILARMYLTREGKPCDGGAVDDLQCTSTAIASLNGSSLNNHIVPCHAIQTTSLISDFVSTDDDERTVLINAALASAVFNVQDFIDDIFSHTPNDMVVPTNSQKGGLNDFSFETGIMHSFSTENSSVINTIKLLLDENPANSVYFDQNVNGFNPPQITPTFSPAISSSTGEPIYSILPNVGTGLVDITSPSPGFICSEGDTVHIDVIGAPNVNHLLLMVNNKNTGTRLFDTLVNSATFHYPVPNNVAGLIKITAMGYDATGFVGSDTLDIFSTPTVPLDSLTFFTDNIYIQQGQSASVTLFGYFNDSTLRNINQLSNIVYEVANPNIASWNAGNVIQGLAIGTTILHASYQNKDVYSFVTVYNLNQVLTNIDVPIGSSKCYNATQTITVAGNGNSFSVQSGGSATMIAGQNIVYLPNTMVQSGGYLWGYIAPTGPWCITPSMPAVLTSQEEPTTVSVKSYFKVYPNPTTGNFILELTGDVSVNKVMVDIYGIWGEKLLSTKLNGERKHEFSLLDKPVGIYFIRVITGDKAETMKIVKQ